MEGMKTVLVQTLATLMCLLLALSPVVEGAAVRGRARRASYNYDCVLLCHAECSVWRGSDLKHCASSCSMSGMASFTHEMCFTPQMLSLIRNSGADKRVPAGGEDREVAPPQWRGGSRYNINDYDRY